MINPKDLTEQELVSCVTEFFTRAIAATNDIGPKDWFMLEINCHGWDATASIELVHRVVIGSPAKGESKTGNLLQSVRNIRTIMSINSATPTTSICLALPAPVEPEIVDADFDEVGF